MKLRWHSLILIFSIIRTHEQIYYIIGMIYVTTIRLLLRMRKPLSIKNLHWFNRFQLMITSKNKHLFWKPLLTGECNWNQTGVTVAKASLSSWSEIIKCPNKIFLYVTKDFHTFFVGFLKRLNEKEWYRFWSTILTLNCLNDTFPL